METLKNIKVNAQQSSGEYLSKDILDEDFVKVFSLYTVIQKVLGSSRVDARDRFITSPTIAQKIYTIGVIILELIVCYITFNLYSIPLVCFPRLYYLSLAGLLLNLFIGISNLLHVRFANNTANVMFYLKMQEIDRIMGIGNCKPINAITHKINNIILVFQLTLILLALIVSQYGDSRLVYCCIYLIVSYMCFAVEIGYCFNLTLFFSVRIRLINAIIDNHFEPMNVESKLTCMSMITRERVSFRYLTSQMHSFETSDIDVYLENILVCFGKYQDLYRFQIFLFFFNYFFFSAVSAQFAIEGMKNNMLSLLEKVILPSFLGFTSYLIAFLCFRLQIFYLELKDTKRLCGRIMSIHLDGPIREKAKKIMKRIEDNFPHFSVYDMWYVDATLIPKVLTLMTTMLVTLLQFAYL